MARKKTLYTEPTDFFPPEVRKKFELGEFNKDAEQDIKKRPIVDEQTKKAVRKKK